MSKANPRAAMAQISHWTGVSRGAGIGCQRLKAKGKRQKTKDERRKEQNDKRQKRRKAKSLPRRSGSPCHSAKAGAGNDTHSARVVYGKAYEPSSSPQVFYASLMPFVDVICRRSWPRRLVRRSPRHSEAGEGGS